VRSSERSGALHHEAVHAERHGLAHEVACSLEETRIQRVRGSFGPAVAHHVEAAAVRQHPIDDGEIGFFLEQRGRALRDRRQSATASAQIVFDQMGEKLADHRVIFDQNDAGMAGVGMAKE